jgi:hypothetical protein
MWTANLQSRHGLVKIVDGRRDEDAGRFVAGLLRFESFRVLLPAITLFQRGLDRVLLLRINRRQADP